MNREEKASIVDELSDKFAKAKIAIITDYRGLTVSVMQELRRKLRENNAEVKVAKNTLLRRAVKGTSFEGIESHFLGTTAVTVSYEDPVTPAKIIVEFLKDNPQLEIKAGSLEGKELSSEDIKALSKLPSKEILLGQLLSVMNAVPTGFVQVLSGVPRNFVNVLQAIKDQKSQADN